MIPCQNISTMMTRLVGAGIPLLFGLSSPRAEQLPVKTYTVADGLGSGYIHHVHCDSRGFIWASTRDGLCRFDGYRFITYGTEHGLPNLAVSKIVESPDGIYFVQTNDGEISGFRPAIRARGAADSLGRAANQKLFLVYPRMGAAPYRGPSGTIWAGGGGSLFRFEAAQNRFVAIASGKALLPDSSMEITTLLEDRAGSLWIGMFNFLPGPEPPSFWTKKPGCPAIASIPFFNPPMAAFGLVRLRV